MRTVPDISLALQFLLWLLQARIERMCIRGRELTAVLDSLYTRVRC